ncbi:ABC transporter [bacterium DOLJORAL78_65_58]|nr:MAG: ABC transporter [bacterium DOLJORAL78_65_58]
MLPADPVSFDVDRGDIVMLAGDNGSGKTTILRGILDLNDRRGGQVIWGVPREKVGYVPQESVIDGSVPARALDVVRTGQPLDWGASRERALEALDQVGLRARADVLFGSLSGGQRQRVLVARALVGGPCLLVLDEPTVNVDAETADQIGSLLENLRSGGLGMVITSHVKDWVRTSRVVRVTGRSSKEGSRG